MNQESHTTRHKRPNSLPVSLRVGIGRLSANWLPDNLIGLDRGRQHESSTPPWFAYVKVNNITTDGRVTLEDIVYVSVTKQKRNDTPWRPGTCCSIHAIG